MATTNGKLISNVEEGKPNRRRYRATDPDFVAPDGGWGWLIVLACGFSNVRPTRLKKYIFNVNF